MIPLLSSFLQMHFNTRYRFTHIVLTVLCISIIYIIIYIITTRTPLNKEIVNEITQSRPFPGRWFLIVLGFAWFTAYIYFSLNYYYNLLAAYKKWPSYLKVSIVIIILSLGYTTLRYFLTPIATTDYDSLGQMYIEMVSSLVPMLICSFIVAYITILREALKQKRILEAQKLVLEAQVSQANFNFLKAQINPHFLHNTLSFLYAKSLPLSAELSEGILTLSDIMRYALSQGNQKDGKAPLKDEIEHVKNVIKVNQLRYNNQLKVDFEETGNVDDLLIIPFVLITLVENAFKHGDLKNQEHPITIKLSVQGRKLFFYCSNKKKSGPKELSTGIGLDNIKNRLDLSYGNNYDFKVIDTAEFYVTELTINEL